MFPPALDEMLRIWQTLEWATYFMVMSSCGLQPQEVGALTWGSGAGLCMDLRSPTRSTPGRKRE